MHVHFFDTIHRLATSFQEKRVEIDIAALRQTCRNLHWVPTEVMLAAALTKRSRQLRDRLRQWQMNPSVSLSDFHNANNSVPSTDPWRLKSKENTTSEILMTTFMF